MGSPALLMRPFSAGLRGVQQAESQEVQLRPAIHRPFERLETIHLTFSLAVTPLPLQRCGNSLKVAAKSTREAVELGHAALFGGDKPWTECLVVTSADELAELQGELLEELNFGPHGPELFQEQNFVRLQAGGGAQEQPRGLTC